MTLASDDRRHGTSNGYSNLSCRCQPCRDAWAVHVRHQRAKRLLNPIADDDPRHGTENLYRNFGCRCDACRSVSTEAGRKRSRDRRAALRRLTDAHAEEWRRLRAAAGGDA